MNKLTVTIVALILLLTQSCGIYSFTGTSLSADVKSFNVEFFQNNAPLVVPSLSNTFTDALKEKFIKNTRLYEVNTDGDIQFTGEIRDYRVDATAITGEEVAALNRLTIVVKVKFVNLKEEDKSFEKDFSAYADFPGAESLDSHQSKLIDEIVKTLIENIFNDSAANW